MKRPPREAWLPCRSHGLRPRRAGQPQASDVGGELAITPEYPCRPSSASGIVFSPPLVRVEDDVGAGMLVGSHHEDVIGT